MVSNSAELRSTLNATLKDSFSTLREHGREDVVERARQLAQGRPPLPRIVIVGETKRGKSTLTNALVGRNLSPVGADETSASFITIIPDAGDQPESALVVGDPGESVRVPLAELPDHTDLQRLTMRGAEAPVSVEVHCRPGPVGSVIVVDTPGIGGLTDARSRLTQQLAADGGMLVFVIDAGSPMSQPELDYLVECGRHLEEITVVVTMVDKYPHSADRIMTHLKGQLRAASPRLGSVPVFRVQAMAAVAALDAPEAVRRQLFERSGLAPLIDRIGLVGGQAALLGSRNGLRVARTGLGEIVKSLRQQALAARNAGSDDHVVEEERITAELADLTTQRSRWKLDFEGRVGQILQECGDLALRESRELEHRMREALTHTPLVRRDAFLRSLNLDLLSELELLAAAVTNHLNQEFAKVLTELFEGADGAPQLTGVASVDDPGRLSRVKNKSPFDPMTVGMGFMAYGFAAKVVAGVGITAASVVAPIAAVAVLPWVAYGLVFKSNQVEKGQLQGELKRVVGDFRARVMGQVNAWVREARPEVLMAYEKVLGRREREIRQAQQVARQARALSAEERKQLEGRIAKQARAVMQTANKIEDALEQSRITGTKPPVPDSDG